MTRNVRALNRPLFSDNMCRRNQSRRSRLRHSSRYFLQTKKTKKTTKIPFFNPISESKPDDPESYFKETRKLRQNDIKTESKLSPNVYSKISPFYFGNPGDRKYPEDGVDCQNCMWPVQSGRVGEGARLRLDFSHPSSNCSCPTFKGSAEVLAGPWRFSSETPVALGRDWSPQTTLREVEIMPTTTTKTTKKSAGFLKGIKDFFKHSFRMDKTTASFKFMTTTTTTTSWRSSPEVAKSVGGEQIQPPSPVPVQRQQVDLGKKDKGYSSFPEIKELSKGREATFNLRIKAVALPRKTGTRIGLKSMKRNSLNRGRGRRRAKRTNVLINGRK